MLLKNDKGEFIMIIGLLEKDILPENIKLKRIYDQFLKLLIELRKKELSPDSIDFINKNVEELNTSNATEKELKKNI